MRAAHIIPLILITTSILFLNLPTTRAQPTWNLRIEVLPGEYYMGEWGEVRLNITNMDCAEHRSEVLTLYGISSKELEGYVERAELMMEMKVLRNYTVTVLKLWGKGGQIYGDYELHLIDACNGRPIKLLGADIWFPWKGFGKALMKWRDVEVELAAYDPIEVVASGTHPLSSTIISFDFYFPETIHPDEIDLDPIVDVRLDFPGWMPYTLESMPVEGDFKLQPYRSFNLTVTDFDGVLKLPGARVVIKRLIYYYEVREYVVPENGTISIRRLQDADYDVTVYWNSSYRQTYPFVHVEQHSAYELASLGRLRTKLFNVKVKTLDLVGRPLIGAKIVFDGFEAVAENGTAAYTLVPEGNHSAQVYWKGITVFNGWLWVGYHPTIYPWMTRPAKVHDLKLPVADLLVQAVDTGGMPVGANFTVKGPTEEVSAENIYSRSGLLNLTQVPLAEYHVKAVNVSKIFENVAKAEGTYYPGELETLQLPIHAVSITTLSVNEKPLKGALIAFGPITSNASESGSMTLSGVPEGDYPVKVYWRGVQVYSDVINVRKSGKYLIKAQVYDIRILFKNAEGEPYLCLSSLQALGGINVTLSTLSKEIEVELVPEGECRLVALTPEGRTLLNITALASQLSETHEITLPIADMRFLVEWSDGEPLEKAEIKIVDLETGEELETLTDENGTAVIRSRPFSNYTIRVNYPYTPIPIKIFNQTFNGQEIKLQAEFTAIQVKVVDLLGNPITGADITVSYGLIPLQKKETGEDGTAHFIKLLRLPTYMIHARYGSKEVEKTCRPGEIVEIKLTTLALKLGEIHTLFQSVIIIAIIAATFLIALRIVLYVKSRLREVGPK